MSTSQPIIVEELTAPLSGAAELGVADSEVETTATGVELDAPQTASLQSDASRDLAEGTLLSTDVTIADKNETVDGGTESLVKELPEEVLAFLVRCTPARALWDWLSQPTQIGLLHSSTRGFQRTASALRQPIVRTRLIRHLYEHTKDFRVVLKLWGEATPPPHVVTEIRALTDEATLESQLSDLWHRHGAEAVLLTLMLDDRRAALEALDALADEAAAQQEDEPDDDGAESGVLNRRLDTRRTMLRRNDERRVEGSALDTSPTPLSPEEEVAQWQKRAEQAEAAHQTTQQELVALRAEWSEAQAQWNLQTKVKQRELQHHQQRLAIEEAHLNETKKTLDRTTRRWKSLQKEFEDLTADNKRLKRQMRRQQQLNEELRKQLATTTARLQSLVPPAAPSAETAKPSVPDTGLKPIAPRPQVAPLDQLFIWQSDGRPFRVTPREVKRAIDRNDEEFVFTLIQAFDALRETNEPGYRMFLDRIREFERYYSRVLTVDTTRVLIDASNVARYENNRYGKGQLRHLLTMRDELRRRDCFPIQIYADASLPYHIDEPTELMQMVKNGEIQMTNPGQEADELLAREARRTGAYVVTNDRSFHTKVSPDFEPPRVTFRIHDGFLIVDDF